ncbi:MAG: trypsin-like peptidase domain-containing protein [bacterium]|nr:trypsin-like peptidase domain-containing protein [bacterium]
MLFDQLKKRRRWLLWLAALGLLVGWSLTWALDAPQRPVLAERDEIRSAAVHISGTACGQFSEGSGFAIETGLLLTNAHVVAGVEQINVSTPDGETAIGELVGFDSGRDIAAISVSGVEVSPAVLAKTVAAEADVGDAATVDRDNGLEFVPFTVNRRIWAKGRDFYGQEAENRRVLEIRSLLAAGDSGAALVNVDDEVWGMVFAVARGQRDQGYALDLVEIGDFLAEIDRTPLPTPPCRTR